MEIYSEVFKGKKIRCVRDFTYWEKSCKTAQWKKLGDKFIKPFSLLLYVFKISYNKKPKKYSNESYRQHRFINVPKFVI